MFYKTDHGVPEMISKKLVLAVIAALSVVAVACSSSEDPTPTPTNVPAPTATPQVAANTIVDIAAGDDRFETLVAAVTAADLAGTLSGEGPFTVFAPTDDAFAALPEGTVEGLLADIPALTEVLTYHVVSGDVRAAQVVTLDSATTLQGEAVDIRVEGESVFLNDAQVIITDLEASNGVIHVIDAVLLPPADEMPEPTPTPAPMETPEPAPSVVEIAVNDGRFNTLVAAVTAAGLVDTLSGDGPFTVFAPTDDAFAALPEGTVEGLLNDIPALTEILTYHVVSGDVRAAQVVELDSATTLQGEDVEIRVEGGNVFVNDSQVIITDIVGSNGVVHVIDAVLLPPADEMPEDSIVDIAVGDGRFTTLVAALTAADLVTTLSGNGPFTVFAPTDDAFAALPEGTVEGLLADIPALRDVLTYHVIQGEVLAADVVNFTSAMTLQGEDVSVRVENGNVFINDSQVIITDLRGSNGVIHVIDAVLLPPADDQVEAPSGTTITDIAAADGRFTTLVAALQAAELDGVLAGDGPFTVFAPTDAAFARLDPGTVEALLNDIPALTDILLYHVVSGEVDRETALTLDLAPTLQGSNLVVDNQLGNVVLNRTSLVITPDVQASNGVIHVVNRVLLPPEPKAEPVEPTIVDIAATDGRFTTLVAALQAAELDGVLAGDGPFTVFAPTDDAFAALPEGTVEALLNDIPALTDILLYHVVDGKVLAEDVVQLTSATTLQGTDVEISLGGGVFINGAEVILADVEGSNGVIHVIDAVLIPAADTESNTIVDIAVADGRFTTLVAALQAADLDGTLSGEGEFTVFAPTDDAFALLPEGTVEALLNDIPALTDILLYHVVAGTVLAEDVVTLTAATTLQGTDVEVRVENGNVFIDDAQVIITDLEASNGVVHVIDMVLIP